MLRLLIFLLIGSASVMAETSWMEHEGVVYGARPGEAGPIGGGAGYGRIVTEGDYTAGSVEALIEALAKATEGEVVFVPGDAVIELTPLVYIDALVLEIPAGVTLASDRGHGGSEGALLVNDALQGKVMLRPLGPGVRVTGLRLQGPNPKRHMEHHRRAFGEDGPGHSYYYKFPTQDGIVMEFDQLETDNCDISGFGHAAIFLRAGTGHHIHHNVIHHCQYHGLGYGVSHDVAESLIEYNRFDANRHSIAGTGRPGCRYVARHNIELGISLSHCFDMHGGRDRKDGTAIAGTRIEIYNNTFRAPEQAVVIRGVPEESCEVHHNWFTTHEDAKAAVRAEERTHVHDNAYGATGEVR
jgi:hypothetical protein